ncbi:hypothetical protein [Streptomyces neyagawaensis]|uniref:hypothetical protein n=1 Tax=Streptomyces neyagawaensis TaxID=42238 RepID=UPI00201CC07D|nr:hypothetical protein [Streptomyces neyagawaensis]MCL6733210.1 hypothetical protein [Streptomyces neyagawaensis]MDE1685012.1 hypothetical protein [Streptomyces neyagawaensis]
MAQAEDWQRDVLRELGQDGAGARAGAGAGTGTGAGAASGSEPSGAGASAASGAAGANGVTGVPSGAARRPEPTLRLVRSVPSEAVERPEPSETAETAEESAGDRPMRAVPGHPAPGQQGQQGQQQERGQQGAVRPEPAPPGPGPGHGMPVGPVPVNPVTAQPAQPVQPTPVVQPPVQPRPGQPADPYAVDPHPVGPHQVDPRLGLPQVSAQSPGAPDRRGDGRPTPRSTPPAAPAPRGSRVPQSPAHTPESVPTIDPRLAHALGRPQHGDSVARRTGRSIKKLTASAAQDVAEETRIARELQQPVTTGRVIAVTSIRGGVGKSTVAALLGRTFNHYRHDPVLTLEADAALGTLPVRMGADSVRWAAADLARILNPAMQLTDVTGYLVPVSDGGWLLPASQGRVGAPLDIRTYRTVTLALRRYFAVTVVDCETLPGEVARTAMDTAHARVVVAPMTAEGVNGTRQVLDWLGQLPHSALASTVVALTANSPDVTLDRKTAVAHLKESGVHVVTVPYDRHLAQGGPIRTALLGQATRDAAVTLAAEAMTRAVRMR